MEYFSIIIINNIIYIYNNIIYIVIISINHEYIILILYQYPLAWVLTSSQNQLSTSSWFYSFSGYLAFLEHLSFVCWLHRVRYRATGVQWKYSLAFNCTTSKLVFSLLYYGFQKALSGSYGHVRQTIWISVMELRKCSDACFVLLFNYCLKGLPVSIQKLLN